MEQYLFFKQTTFRKKENALSSNLRRLFPMVKESSVEQKNSKDAFMRRDKVIQFRKNCISEKMCVFFSYEC